MVLAAFTLAAAIVSGTIPALQSSASTIAGHLRTGPSVTIARSRFRTVVLVAQVALALVLVVAAGLFVRSVHNFRADFSYDVDRVVTAALDFRRSGRVEPRQIHETFELLLERVRRLPQVERAG